MRWRHGVLIAVLMTPGAAVGDADGPARLLMYRNGRLSARLDRVPLEQVLTALSQATGAAIHGRPLAPWEVSAHFDAEPLRAALAEAVAAVEADGTLRVPLLSTLRGMSDDTLTTLVRAWTGNRADELVTQVAQRSRDGYLRDRAASVLARLRLAATAARGTGGPLSRARG